MARRSEDSPLPDRLAVLLLPRTLEQFILRDQATDLLSAPGVIGVEPGRMPYGVWGRVPVGLGFRLALGQARRMRLPGRPRVFVMFHPLQWPLARALLSRWPEAELWYSRWDRYEVALDASPALRSRLATFHEQAASASSLTFVVSRELGRLEEDAGRSAVLVPLAADSFPSVDPSVAVTAVSLGHLGHRVDWSMLREVASRMPGLTLLLIGSWHDDELAGDADYAWCRSSPAFVWLGRRTDEEAARLIALADVGIVPFREDPFNTGALPYRVLKYARQGLRTVAPRHVAGLSTWSRAVDFVDGADDWVAALGRYRGASPDLSLRSWALGQSAREVNRPLFERLEDLGVETGRLGSERARAGDGETGA